MPTAATEAPRALTPDEVRDRLLAHVALVRDHWVTVWEEGVNPLVRDPFRAGVKRVVDGALFSLLALLDGAAVGVPRFVVAPDPHPDDREFRRAHGQNWFPDVDARPAGDVAGDLHERWARMTGEADGAG